MQVVALQGWWKVQEHAALRRSQSAWNGRFSLRWRLTSFYRAHTDGLTCYALDLSTLELRPACLLGYTSLGVALKAGTMKGDTTAGSSKNYGWR
jgi:hypothetical protein